MIPWSASSGATKNTPYTASRSRAPVANPVTARRRAGRWSVVEDMVIRRVGHKPEDYRIDPEEQQVTTVFRQVVRPPCDRVRGPGGGDYDGQQRGQEQHGQQQLAGPGEEGQ